MEVGCDVCTFRPNAGKTLSDTPTREWHATHMEAVYSIMFWGELRPSSLRSPGGRISGGLEAVYTMTDELKDKAIRTYSSFAPLGADGALWRVVLSWNLT